MRGGRYLRDVRHLDKFLYILNDGLFYEPAEEQYEALPDYIDIVTALVRECGGDWTTARQGFWFHVHPRQADVPMQGWKVHVSAVVRNGALILKRAAKIALANNVPFKFALDKNVLSTMSSKRWPRGGSGKFITMYPSDRCCFENLLEQLYTELRDDEGPYILSDKRYKDCRVLYYRFGGMAVNTRLEVTGLRTPVLVSPEGEAVPDVRTPYFAPPIWETDPFPSKTAESQEPTLNAGRYRVKKALAFSNSGGVYLAEDRLTGAEVIIKEARALTVIDDRGNDAIHRLKKELKILEVLGDTGVTPRPVDSFQEWENFFLVEEYVDGIDVRDLMLSESPVLRAAPSLEESSQYYETFKKTFINLANAVRQLHEHGVVFGDLSPVNIKTDRSTCAVRLIDCEVAFRPAFDESTYLYTPGFRNVLSLRSNAQGFADDLYSLAAVMMYALFPVAVFSSLREDLFDTVLETVLADIGWSQTEVGNIIRGLSRNEMSCARACELLERPVKIVKPYFHEEVDAGACRKISEELGSFLLSNMRADGESGLFPADPFAHQTNHLSLGFGACGVLYSLNKCGFEVPRAARDWLEQELDKAKPERLPPGIFTGA
ncbi:MAG TPA: membrane translocator, partial [Candidatus Angelobacter sp.]